MNLPAFARSVALSLRPGPQPLSIAAAARAFAAVALIASFGVLVGDLQTVAVAYLGAACAVAFVVAGPYRDRVAALAAQGVGAAIGISVGALAPASAPVLIGTAAVAGAVSGAVGTIGPSAPGFGMMLSIGVAFGQFGGSTLSWWQQAVGYLVGTAVVAVAALAPWVFRRGIVERETLAAVMSAAAELCVVAGTPDGRDARMRLAAASAAARGTGSHAAVELVAFAAATMYADGERVPDDAVAVIRAAGAQIRAGEPVTVQYQPLPGSPGLQALANALSRPPQRSTASRARRFRAAVRAVWTPTAAANATRLALCLGLATALTVALHEPAHSFWLPLTVAVIVRPEYASVFVRTVNRVCGTLAGAGLTAVLLLTDPPAEVIALAAAAALAFSVLTAAKLYAFSVIGITASALLSASLVDFDPVLSGLRLLDTLLGAVVAVVFGYLLWPGARRFPTVARLDAAVAAAETFLDEAVKEADERVRWQARRDDAYRLTHQARAAAQAALAEPPPVSSMASEVVPAAIELEDIVDAITAVAAARDAGEVDEMRVAKLRRRLSELELVGR
jgi:uncharacterized membrane protein YccC